MKPERKRLKNLVIKLRKQGIPTQEIMNITGVNKSSIHRWTTGLGIPYAHPLYDCDEVNHDFFSKTNLTKYPERYVLIGFIAADGCISSRDKQLCFNISKKDAFVVHEINNLLANGKKNISEMKSTNSLYLRFSSKQIALDLSRFGIIPKKTSVFDLPQLSFLNMSYFLRGYIYGDGCVFDYGKTNFGYSIICTSNMGYKLRSWLKTHNVMDHCVVSERKQNPLYCQVRWGGRRSLPISQFAFNDDKMVLLPRKHIKFHEIKKDIEPLTGPSTK